MDIVKILIQLAAGALGGVGAGKAMPKLSLGNVGNILAGLVGGGLVGQLLGPLGLGGGTDLMGIISSVLGGGIGGGGLMAIISGVKNMLGKK